MIGAPCFRLFGLCGLFAFMSMAANAAPSESLQIAGAVSQPRSWSVAQIQHELPGSVHPLAYTLKGKHHTAQVVSLWTLLQASSPRLNPRIKHHALQFVVAVQGQDGYCADFTFGELSPEFGHRAVWVALAEDGQPLLGDFGPVELLVPDDLQPARWVHSVRLITVLDMAQTAAPGV